MKPSLLLSLVALVRQATCYLEPAPDTASDCLKYYDNVYEDTCETVLDYWNITPEELYKWNPSVGLDCKLRELQSYCVFTEKLDSLLKTATTSSSSTKASTSTSTTTLPTPDPSPTVWIAQGCYADDDSNTCYLNSYGFAGLQDGNQCWCSNSLEGWLAENQTDCYVPCTGDKKTFCGGKRVINVFRAEDNLEPLSTAVTTSSAISSATPSTTSSATISSVGSAAETVLSATQSSGARRNRALF
ncbi:hypothetical protein VE03_03434 [Pseudogymnoascus sp. 23342-1-I1]|nr:hypothetical protein VE03_03434 [Pseudogymnoascus sp. 23342-1-I1]